MRIPFPERIPLFYAGIFAALLSVLLVASGTGAMFSAVAFVFILLTTLTFNLAGGMTQTSGTYVFFFAVLAVILGLMVKVAIWEPAEVLLHSPITTIGAYTGGMLGMLGAVYLSRRFSRKEGFLQNICSTENMGRAAVGCVIGGYAIPVLAALVPPTNTLLTPLFSALIQMNQFPNMAIILAVTYEIKVSGGKRSLNAATWFSIAYFWYFGVVLGFSKQALFTPLVCWLVACAALRYRFAFYQFIVLGLVLAFSNYYLVPYCQYGRGLNAYDASMSTKLATAVDLLTHLDDVRAKYQESIDPSLQSEDEHRFFVKEEGLFERLEMFGIDDALITLTDDKGTFGMSPYMFYVASFVPRVLWKDKPQIGMGNVFAHELGFNEEDTTTGISFSPVGEVYHEATWLGVLIVAPVLWTLLFTIMNSLCGDMRKSPWGLLVLALFAHIAPEGGIQGVFYVMSYGAVIVLVVAYFSSYVMPMLSALVMPPKRSLVPIGAARPGRAGTFSKTEPLPAKR